MKKKYALIILLFFCALFCLQAKAQNNKIDSSKMVTLRIDPSTAVGAPVSRIFEDIEFIHDLLWDLAADRQTMVPPGQNKSLNFLQELCLARQGQSSKVLLDLLVKGRKFAATNPRDKAFAFLGIYEDIFDRNETSFKVDYSLPVSKVYQQAATHILEKERDLRILLQCGSFREQDTCTWVPDFSVASYHLNALRESSNNVTRVNVARFSIDEKTNCFTIRGLHFDVVSEKTIPLLPQTSEINPKLLNEFVIKSASFQTWATGVAKLAYGDMQDAEYVGGSTITGALNQLFELSAFPPGTLDPHSLAGISFLDLLSGRTIGSNPFYISLAVHIVQRKLASLSVFRTEKGYLGIGDEGMEPGDIITILYGLQLPVILRRVEESWNLVGICFVVGIMRGEAIDMSLKEEDFRIQ